jgi:hypothetical protein
MRQSVGTQASQLAGISQRPTLAQSTRPPTTNRSQLLHLRRTSNPGRSPRRHRLPGPFRQRRQLAQHSYDQIHLRTSSRTTLSSTERSRATQALGTTVVDHVNERSLIMNHMGPPPSRFRGRKSGGRVADTRFQGSRRLTESIDFRGVMAVGGVAPSGRCWSRLRLSAIDHRSEHRSKVARRPGRLPPR